MKYLVSFLQFWYDFIVGDCWQIAAGVVLVLAGGAWLAHAQVFQPQVITPVVGVGIILVAVLSLLVTTGKK